MSIAEEQVRGRITILDKLLTLINAYYVGRKVICWHQGD